MNKEEYGIITFESIHYALKFEKYLEKAKLEFRTIPTPREISLSCGISIRFKQMDIDRIKNIIEKSDLSIKGLYKYVKEDDSIKLERIM